MSKEHPLCGAHQSALRHLLLTLCGLGCLLGAPRAASGTKAFLLGQTESTITNLLFPWTQTSACACCVCWETAEATVMAYWDDQRYQSAGPWELLLPYGNGLDEAAFRQATAALFAFSGLACGEGVPSNNTLFGFCAADADIAKAYTNTTLGYSFSYDEDDWVWFGPDIKNPIDQGRPIYYGYTPEGNSGHAVVIVGYDDSDQTIFIYKNWDPVVTQKGFDEASEHCTIDVSPGGLAPAPSSWTCGLSSYGRGDGCDCACGGYDPDCDDPTQPVKNCGVSESCSTQGTCLSTCQDECLSGASECATDTALRICRDVDGDGCLEWEQIPCTPGNSCTKGQCVACVSECEGGQARCLDAATYQVCTVSAAGCGLWSPAQACNAGFRCQSGACIPCPAGDCSSCLDECAPEQTRCATGTAVQLCDGYSPQGCLLWSSWVPCLVGQECQGGQCVAASSGGEGGCGVSLARPALAGNWLALCCLLALMGALRRRA